MRRTRSPLGSGRRGQGTQIGLAQSAARRRLRDVFSGADESPVAAERKAIPGPGSAVLTELSGAWSIGDGALSFSGPATASWGELAMRGVLSPGVELARSWGPTIAWKVQVDEPSGEEDDFLILGCWPSTVQDTAVELAVTYQASTGSVWLADGVLVGNSPVGEPFWMAVQVRPEGGEDWWYRGSRSNDEWWLAYRRGAGSSETLHSGIVVGCVDGALLEWRIDEGGWWKVTPAAEIALPEEAVAYPAPADALYAWTLECSGLTAGDRAGIEIRRLSADRSWKLCAVVNEAETAVELVLSETVGGVEIERAVYTPLLTEAGSCQVLLRALGLEYLVWQRPHAASTSADTVLLYTSTGGDGAELSEGVRVVQGGALRVSGLTSTPVKGYR